MNLAETSKELGNEGYQLIKEICNVAWTRLPGSKGEHDAQTFLSKKFQEWGADRVDVRPFKVYAKFFLWWPRLSIIFFYASVVTYIFFPMLAFFFAIFAVLNILLKFFSFTFFDVLFPKTDSCNVIGKLHAKNVGETGKPKMILLLGGHTDSNYEYPIGRKFGLGMIKVLIPVFILMGVWLLATLIRFAISASGGTLFLDFGPAFVGLFTSVDIFFIIALVGTPYISWVGFRMVSSLPVPGANDNLSGVVVAAETFKYFAQNRPNNVELWAVGFGSEEGGMMGSKNLAQDVRIMLDHGWFPAERLWVINFDGVGADGPVQIATKEPMYRVKGYDPLVYNALAASAKAASVNHYVKSLSFGGTDSAPFARLGIPGAALLCFGNGTTPPNWHCREDTPYNVDYHGLINCIKLIIRFVKDMDASL